MNENREYMNYQFFQKFGYRFPKLKPNGIWIHAVSVGEIHAANPLIQYILLTYPKVVVIVTTMTETGADRVNKLFKSRVHHCYLPYDYPGAMTRFIQSTTPSIGIVMETEIWPNMIHVCWKHNIPMLYINVRLSKRSYERYLNCRSLIRSTLKKVSEFAVQSEEDAIRLIRLGAQANKVYMTGSIKFDISLPNKIMRLAQALRQKLGSHRPVWVVGSTHSGEELIVLDAFFQIKQEIPKLLLILVPRHPARFSEVFRLCTRIGFSTSRRSENLFHVDSEIDIYLGDTLGELMLLIAASDIAFIGGSLVPTGGHNVLEASALGVPVIFGPYMFNFSKVADLVTTQGAGIKVLNSSELSQAVINLFKDPALREAYSTQGRKLIQEHKGALKKICVMIEQYIKKIDSKI